MCGELEMFPFCVYCRLNTNNYENTNILKFTDIAEHGGCKLAGNN